MWGFFHLRSVISKPSVYPVPRAKMLRSLSGPGTLKALIDPKQQKCYNYNKSKNFDCA